MDNNLIAVLMCTYNGSKFIEDQLISLENQTFKNFRIYISDDGSNDDTINIIRKFISKSSIDIELVENTQLGSGAAKNFMNLLKHVSENKPAKYYMFCDQDDFWLPDKIKICYDKAITFDESVPLLIHSDLKVVDQSLNLVEKSFVKMRKLDPSETRLERLIIQNNVTGCTMFFNQNLVDCINFSNTNDISMHDWWIALVASICGKIVFINDQLILYRQHGNNVVGATKVNSLSFIIRRLTHSNHIRNTLVKSIIQSKKLYEDYNYMIDEKNRQMLEEFNNILNKNKFHKVNWLIKQGVLKQGIIQNIGLFIFI